MMELSHSRQTPHGREYFPSFNVRVGTSTGWVLSVTGVLHAVLGILSSVLGSTYKGAIWFPCVIVGASHVITGVVGISTEQRKRCQIVSYMVMTIIAEVLALGLLSLGLILIIVTPSSLVCDVDALHCNQGVIYASWTGILILIGIEIVTDMIAACTCCRAKCLCCRNDTGNPQPYNQRFPGSNGDYQRLYDEEEGRLQVIPDELGSYVTWKISAAKPSSRNLDADENYVMHLSRRKGLAVIINNSNFRAGRQGSDVDMANIVHVMEELGYEVITRKDLSADSVHTVLDNVVVRINEDGPDEHLSFVLVLMSHGDERGIYGIDREVVTVKDVQTKFSGRKCHALLDKPKIFFIQACRGRMMTRSALACDGPQDFCADQFEVQPAEDQIIAPPVGLPGRLGDYDTDSDLPDNADMFVAHSTSDGYLSLRDRHTGSLFISFVCEELLSAAHVDDLDTIMNRVTRRITGHAGYIRDGEGNRQRAMQTPHISKQGVRKKIFFTPKYPPSDTEE